MCVQFTWNKFSGCSSAGPRRTLTHLTERVYFPTRVNTTRVKHAHAHVNNNPLRTHTHANKRQVCAHMRSCVKGFFSKCVPARVFVDALVCLRKQHARTYSTPTHPLLACAICERLRVGQLMAGKTTSGAAMSPSRSPPSSSTCRAPHGRRCAYAMRRRMHECAHKLSGGSIFSIKPNACSQQASPSQPAYI